MSPERYEIAYKGRLASQLDAALLAAFPEGCKAPTRFGAFPPCFAVSRLYDVTAAEWALAFGVSRGLAMRYRNIMTRRMVLLVRTEGTGVVVLLDTLTGGTYRIDVVEFRATYREVSMNWAEAFGVSQ
jgi:hypothetical protein